MRWLQVPRPVIADFPEKPAETGAVLQAHWVAQAGEWRRAERRRHWREGETPGAGRSRGARPHFPPKVPASSLRVLGERTQPESGCFPPEGAEFTRNEWIDSWGDRCPVLAARARSLHSAPRTHAEVALPRPASPVSVSSSADIHALMDGDRRGRLLSPCFEVQFYQSRP